MAKALIVASAGSGQGKTLVTAGLAQALQAKGHRVRVFKMGPDFIDPLFLQAATGVPVQQLDYWLMGAEGIRKQLAAVEPDCLVLIEGMMGLYDGRYPTSQLAVELQIPVLLVIDGSAMAQTFGALVEGLQQYHSEIQVAGVIANKVGGEVHAEMLKESVKDPGLFLGWLQRGEDLKVSERHLGIETEKGAEIEQIAMRTAVEMESWIDKVATCFRDLEVVGNRIKEREVPYLPLQGVRIAVARDEAFLFIYEANIEFLQRNGATICWFSPLRDNELPECDSLYLPGGYPELHLLGLSRNLSMLISISQHIESSKPCLAECGGMLYLLEGLSWKGIEGKLVGALNGTASVTDRLAAIGYQQRPDDLLKGHSFHHGRTQDLVFQETALDHQGKQGEGIVLYKRTRASFVHWYFDSDPSTIIEWFASD